MGVIKTPECMASFPCLVTKRAVSKEPGSKEKFSIVLVFGPDVDPAWAEEAIEAAGIEKWGEAKYTKLVEGKNFKYPLKLNDDDGEDARYADGSWYLNCYSDTKPGCVFRTADPKTGLAQRMTDAEVEELIYPGAMIRASVRFYGFDKGSNGVAVGINNLQLLDATTPRLDSRVAAEKEFEAEDVDDADLPEVEEEAPAPRRGRSAPARAAKPTPTASRRRATKDVEDLL